MGASSLPGRPRCAWKLFTHPSRERTREEVRERSAHTLGASRSERAREGARSRNGRVCCVHAHPRPPFLARAAALCTSRRPITHRARGCLV